MNTCCEKTKSYRKCGSTVPYWFMERFFWIFWEFFPFKMKNVISHKVTCMQDEIEPTQGKNETNIRKLRKTQNYSLTGSDLWWSSLMDLISPRIMFNESKVNFFTPSYFHYQSQHKHFCMRYSYISASYKDKSTMFSNTNQSYLQRGNWQSHIHISGTDGPKMARTLIHQVTMIE